MASGRASPGAPASPIRRVSASMDRSDVSEHPTVFLLHALGECAVPLANACRGLRGAAGSARLRARGARPSRPPGRRLGQCVAARTIGEEGAPQSRQSSLGGVRGEPSLKNVGSRHVIQHLVREVGDCDVLVLEFDF